MPWSSSPAAPPRPKWPKPSCANWAGTTATWTVAAWTGRGTPYGLAECPVVKVATRSDLARRWHDLMDINAGKIADGEATIEELGWELFHLLLDVGRRRHKTSARQWKLHNALVLFNPAPVT